MGRDVERLPKNSQDRRAVWAEHVLAPDGLKTKGGELYALKQELVQIGSLCQKAQKMWRELGYPDSLAATKDGHRKTNLGMRIYGCGDVNEVLPLPSPGSPGKECTKPSDLLICSNFMNEVVPNLKLDEYFSGQEGSCRIPPEHEAVNPVLRQETMSDSEKTDLTTTLKLLSSSVDQ